MFYEVDAYWLKSFTVTSLHCCFSNMFAWIPFPVWLATRNLFIFHSPFTFYSTTFAVLCDYCLPICYLQVLSHCISICRYYKLVIIIPIFQYSNVYMVTADIQKLYRSKDLQNRCMQAVKLPFCKLIQHVVKTS